jgi:hypothetical protein
MVSACATQPDAPRPYYIPIKIQHPALFCPRENTHATREIAGALDAKRRAGKDSWTPQDSLKSRAWAALTAVDFPAVADLDYPDSQLGVLYRIDDTVVPLTKAILFLAGEFFATHGTGLLGKASYAFDDPLQVIFGNGVQVLPDRLFKKDAINGHWP